MAAGRGRTVHADPVAFWLSRLELGTAKNVRGDLRRFMQWLHRQPGWEDMDERGLLERQMESYADDPCAILNLIQAYLGGCQFAKSTNKRNYSAIRSFFLHNRVPLPEDPSFRVPGFRAPSVGRLTEQNIAEIALAAKLRDRSLILVKWQGLLDTASVMWVGIHLADEITQAIHRGECPIRLDIPGRKHSKNEKVFYTYIGRDAIDALVKYFEHERGWPKKGRPIWLNLYGRPMNERTWCELWCQLTRRVGLIPQERAHDSGTRYGYNTHEMRDVARSLLHTKAKHDGLDELAVEFWMGHEVDPLHYNKFYLDRDYMLSQYKIAEPYLDIISHQPEELKTVAQENVELRERLTRLEGQFETILKTRIRNGT